MSGEDATPQDEGLVSIVLLHTVVPFVAFTQYRSPVCEPTNTRSPDAAGVDAPPRPPIGFFQITAPVVSFRQNK
ncbi:MAG: hypothetical protein C5S52_00215 [ANME-2 cluster archaeon]|nr:hypothetical protein [ANME-2 cluster archaeon]